MLQTNQKNANLAMREQQRMHSVGSAFKPYNTGAVATQDVMTYTVASRLHIPGASITSTGIGTYVVTQYGRVTPDQAQDALRPSDIVTMVRKVFGLNVSDAAQVFGVGRPTIYLWADSHDMGSVRPKKQARMKQLLIAATLCKQLAPLPVAALRAVLPVSGKTLLDMLSEEMINLDQLGQAYQHLETTRATFRKQEHHKAVEAIKGLKGAFQTLGAQQAARKKG